MRKSKEKTREYHKKYYAANKQKYLDKNYRWEQTIKDLIREAKQVPCADCQQKYPHFVMDFDHLPEFEKSFNLAEGHKKGINKVKEEIAKCEVVCSNCHRIRTNARVTQQVE